VDAFTVYIPSSVTSIEEEVSPVHQRKESNALPALRVIGAD
jgi:hypothetical protein